MKTQDVTAKGVPAAALKKEKRKRLLNQLLSQKFLYLMILPGLLYFLVFKYVPMWGLIIAFQDYHHFSEFLAVSGLASNTLFAYLQNQHFSSY